MPASSQRRPASKKGATASTDGSRRQISLAARRVHARVVAALGDDGTACIGDQRAVRLAAGRLRLAREDDGAAHEVLHGGGGGDGEGDGDRDGDSDGTECEREKKNARRL